MIKKMTDQNELEHAPGVNKMKLNEHNLYGQKPN